MTKLLSLLFVLFLTLANLPALAEETPCPDHEKTVLAEHISVEVTPEASADEHSCCDKDVALMESDCGSSAVCTCLCGGCPAGGKYINPPVAAISAVSPSSPASPPLPHLTISFHPPVWRPPIFV